MLDITELTDKLWRKYFEFKNELYMKFYPGLVFIFENWQEFKKQKMIDIELFQKDKYNEYILLNDDEVTGSFYRFITPIHIIFGFDTIYNDLPGEIYYAIFANVLEFLNENKKQEAFTVTYDERILKQIMKLNPEKVEDFPLTYLLKKNIDIAMINNAVIDFESRNGYKITFLRELPENLLDKYVRFVKPVFEELIKANPALKNEKIVFNENDMKEEFLMMTKHSFSTDYFYLLWNELDEIIGLHNVIIDKNEPGTIKCNGGLTCVGKDYRGKGIGKYLKSKMILYLMENYTDFDKITSDTMPWNKHMFKINEELGFKPYKTGARFRFSKEFLENYLQINKST